MSAAPALSVSLDQDDTFVRIDGLPIPVNEFDLQVARILDRRKTFQNTSLRAHVRRYFHSAANVPHGRWLREGDYSAALEVGSNYIFPEILRDKLKFERVDYTDFDRPGPEVVETRMPGDWKDRLWRSFRIDVETDPIPADDETYDLILCFEVLEHLECDPMAAIAEFNRVLKPQGLLYLSTPNSTSARNIMRILNGYEPHFFMGYRKDGGLYRHNIEYGPRKLSALLLAAGFKIRKMWTEDLFEDPVPDAIEMLKREGKPTTYRGDNIHIIVEKEAGVRDRHPKELYY